MLEFPRFGRRSRTPASRSGFYVRARAGPLCVSFFADFTTIVLRLTAALLPLRFIAHFNLCSSLPQSTPPLPPPSFRPAPSAIRLCQSSGNSIKRFGIVLQGWCNHRHKRTLHRMCTIIGCSTRTPVCLCLCVCVCQCVYLHCLPPHQPPLYGAA